MPNRGACCTAAWSMPSTFISMLYSALPVDLSYASRRFTGLPIQRNWLGSRSFTLATSGTGRSIARPASSPYVRDRPEAACTTLPGSVDNSPTGTFNACAPASSNIARASAPSRRIVG